MAVKKSGRRDNKDGQIVEDGKFFRARLEIGRDPKTAKPIYKTARLKTKAEALTALDQLKVQYATTPDAPTERSNFGEFLDHWLLTAVKPSKSHNTYRQYEWIVRTHIKPHLGSKQTDKIARGDVQKLLSLKATQTVAPRDGKAENVRTATLSTLTLRHILATLHNAFEEAIRHGLTAKNPAENVDLPRKSKEPKKQFMNMDETIKFMKALDKSDLADLFAFMIATGTRLGEATGVRWQDVDLSVPNRPLVWIRGQLHRIDGQLAYETGTKTNQERCLPLTADVAARIKTLADKREARIAQRLIEAALGLVRTTKKGKPIKTTPEDPDGIVFLNSEGRRLDPKHVNLRLAELCKEAKVERISAHKLRHTAATLALAETGDLHGVQKMLGHSQVSLTSDLYGHATAETLRPLANAIEKALRGI